MGHQWIRLDVNLPTHDKMLRLLINNHHRAAFAYVCSLAWSGGNETNGKIPSYALTMIHARPTDADALVDVGLWAVTDDGWEIHNWADRQAPHSGKKAACIRWHGKGCNCWEEPK